MALDRFVDSAKRVLVRVCGYHLPGIGGPISVEAFRCGAVEVEIPRLRSDQFRGLLDRARDAACRHLRRRPVGEILAAVDRVAANWLRPDYPLRRQAEQILPLATGFSAASVRHGLPLLFEQLRAPTIQGLLDAELGDHRVLDGMHGGRHAAGPTLITHVLSGNIPGLAAAPALLSLALKSAVLVKSAAGDPVFPALLAASVSEVDPDLARCLLVTYWRGGHAEVEDVALSAPDVVVASGSDAAIAALAARVRTRLIGHGHKLSFAAIGRDVLTAAPSAAELARRLAYDVALWDQQGCLSPQLCFIETEGAVSPRQFAAELAQALRDYAVSLPPRQLGIEEQAAVQRFRQHAEWSAGVVLLASGDSTDWSISIEPDAQFVPTCLNRCLRIKVVSDLSQLAGVLTPHGRRLEAAGVAVGAQRLTALSAVLAACGVHRICRIGEMQRPPLSWHQGGRPRVADWVEWTVAEDGEKVTG